MCLAGLLACSVAKIKDRSHTPPFKKKAATMHKIPPNNATEYKLFNSKANQVEPTH